MPYADDMQETSLCGGRLPLEIIRQAILARALSCESGEWLLYLVDDGSPKRTRICTEGAARDLLDDHG
jgi:hypothetical protein